MREAIAKAEVGDDVLDGDPEVRRLEQLAANWLGKNGALFVPSGTMANQVALGVWTRPGDEIVTEASAHVIQWESGAAAANHAVQARVYRSVDGAADAEDLEHLILADSSHGPRTALVCVEQTFLGSGEGPGGVVIPLDRLEGMADICAQRGIPIHMDGARLAHAVVQSDIPACEWAAYADSVSLCLSKGLGAPVGSIIAGDEDFIARARVVRKRLGGAMRQAGFLAAAGRVALEENVERLRDDHGNARELARRLDRLPGLTCPEQEVQTNIVMVRLARELDPETVVAELAKRGFGTMTFAPRTLRFVTHMDVNRQDVLELEGAMREVTARAECVRSV